MQDAFGQCGGCPQTKPRNASVKSVQDIHQRSVGTSQVVRPLCGRFHQPTSLYGLRVRVGQERPLYKSAHCRGYSYHKKGSGDTLLRDKSLSLEQLETLVREYDTTVPPIQAYPRQSTRLDYAPPAFGCYFGQKEISLITHYAFEAFLFIGGCSEAEIEALFSCSLQTPLQVRNNRMAAIFFDELSRKNLICREWQLVIDKNGLLESSTGTKLTANKLSSALSQSQGNDIKYRPKFAEMAKQLQIISSTDKNENK